MVDNIDDITDAINAPVKDDEIYAAMSAVFFDNNHLSALPQVDLSYSCALLETSSMDAGCSQPIASLDCTLTGSGSDPLTVQVLQTADINPTPVQNLEQDIKFDSPTGSLKTETEKPKKRSKILKSKKDLDQCLETRKLKRKAERLKERETRDNQFSEKALTTPQQCLVCGKKFRYRGYLQTHMR